MITKTPLTKNQLKKFFDDSKLQVNANTLKTYEKKYSSYVYNAPHITYFLGKSKTFEQFYKLYLQFYT